VCVRVAGVGGGEGGGYLCACVSLCVCVCVYVRCSAETSVHWIFEKTFYNHWEKKIAALFYSETRVR
jgi:hypothetical protein